MMMHMIACCENTTCVLPYGSFLTKVFNNADVDLSRKTNFKASSTYNTYDDQFMGMMKFEKALDGSQVRKAERAPTLARRQGQSYFGVEEEVEIREMEGEVDPQSGHQQRGLELDFFSLQTKTPPQTGGVQFETTFSELTFVEGPSTQSSYIEFSLFGLAFIKSTHTEIPPPQAPFALDHALWMDLSTQISSFSTRMEELAVVSDTSFYFMEDRINQYQVGFTSLFEYLQQRIDHIEDHLECQHEEMIVYLCSVFLPPLPQP